jgi:hypothetical protein
MVEVKLLFSFNSSYLDLQEAVSGFKLAQIIIEIEKFLLQSIPTPPPFVQDVSFASDRNRATQYFPTQCLRIRSTGHSFWI